MTNSMTAFARAETDLEGNQLTWEIRSVNHRYLDVHLRLADELRCLDTVCRRHIAAKLSRGRIDAQLRLERSNPLDWGDGIDAQSLASLVFMLKQVEKDYPQAKPARSTDILRWPGIIKESRLDKALLEKQVLAALDKALSELTADRMREGGRLSELISEKAARCLQIVGALNQSIGSIQKLAKDKMENKIKEAAGALDQDRLAQEVALLLTKSDVSEEIDRLRTHLDEITRLLNAEKPVGRTLDFLMQELHREANTLGAKSIDAGTTDAAIELKVLIDQMREQVQNIE